MTFVFISVVLKISDNYFIQFEKGLEFTNALVDADIKALYSQLERKASVHISISRFSKKGDQFHQVTYSKVDFGDAIGAPL